MAKIANLHPIGYNFGMKTKIGQVIKAERKRAGLTQEEFAVRSDLGLRFVRELEQGKSTLRMDKVAQALAYFSYHLEPVGDENQ